MKLLSWLKLGRPQGYSSTLARKLWSGGLVLAALCGASRQPALSAPPDAPRVAVFMQPGFPYYMVSTMTAPQNIAADLRQAGLQADLLDVAALSDPQRFNARRYSALVLPYGNNYPQDAFANMRAFHHAGGSLILSGIPFTHPVAGLAAASWSASPDWGGAVRLVADGHAGTHSLELTGPASDWVGVNSARFMARPGDKIVVSGWAKDAQGQDAGDDWVYLRFYNRNGTFIDQRGALIGAGMDWHHIEATITAPPATANFDVAPQVRSAGRTVRLDDLQVTQNGHDVAVPNSNFETGGNDWSDLGHSSEPALFGPEGIGVGGFVGPGQESQTVAIAAGDPLGIAALKADWQGKENIQWLDATTLPPQDKVIPALTVGGKPTTALIVHHAPAFQGAVDVWTTHGGGTDLDAYLTEQLLARGTLAALATKGLVTPGQRLTAFAALNRAPRPTVYANLTLPTLPRPYATFQPKMPPPARHLYVADIRPLSHDEKVALLSLQGIVNRKQPRIYLLCNDEDAFWLQEMQRQGQTAAPITVADPLTLVRQFKTSTHGAVVPDPKIYVSPSIAVSIAGADDLIIATPQLAQRLGLPIKTDLRGKWKDDVAALRYLRTDLLPRLNPYLATCLDPQIFDRGAIDQIIAAKGLAFWVTGPKAQGQPGANMGGELAEVKVLLSKMPLNAIVRGFWWHGNGWGLDEGTGVSTGSRFGKVTVVSDFVSNFSVLSGVKLPALKQKPRPPAPPLDRSKVYIALTMSDGDNLTTWSKYFRGYFDDPLHGTFPIAWGMGPTLIDVAPTWARWYYEHAAPNDEFICDVSGVGYMYPQNWATALKDRDGARHSFYAWTQAYMQRMDMTTVRLMGVSAGDIAKVAPDLPKVPFLMPDYGYSGEKSYPEFTYTLPTGQPAFRAITNGEGGVTKLVDQVRTRIGPTRPAFANVFIWNWGYKMSDIKQILDLLGPDYVPVTPSQLATLYGQSQAGTTK